MAEMKTCPKCGGMFDGRGLQMHMNFCKGTGDHESKQIDRQESTKKCIKCSSENLLRLDEYQKQSGKDYDLPTLYSKGYTHVCVDCGEVLK